MASVRRDPSAAVLASHPGDRIASSISQGSPHLAGVFQDSKSHAWQMARPQKPALDFPWREGAQAATAIPVPLPGLKGSFVDRPLHQGLLRPARRLCSPTLPPTPKSPKKPKMQSPEEVFPTDWSPPPVEFLNLRLLRASPYPTGQSWVGALGPQDQRRLPEEQEPQDSLEELFWNMAGPSQPAATPEADGHTSFSSGSSEHYFNNLDYLLQEKREQAPELEREKLLLEGCLHLSSLDLDREEAPLTPEHRMLVERFSVSLQDIPPVHPGETVFLPRGDVLPCVLDSSHLKPRSHLEELFLSSPLDQQLSFLHSGLLSNLYLHASDCLVPLLQWLFQLLTWPPETSSRAFGLLWDLSVDGLFQQSVEDMRLWYPSLQEVMEALRSLGARGPALCLLGPEQHGSRVLGNEASQKGQKQQDLPQEAALDMSLGYIYKFLALCALAQPGAYTDANLLGLIELLCRAGLDVGLRLMPKTDLQQLLLLLLDNIREWPGKLQPLCRALSLVSDHHHNLLALVQLFPDVTSRSRGDIGSIQEGDSAACGQPPRSCSGRLRQLRSQLGLVVIARMLGQQEALPLWQEKTQLPLLSRLLSLMRPSSLAQHLGSGPLPPGQKPQPKASAELDHQVCYLCHSLLTLAGLVVSSQDFTPDQWGGLQLLCMQLDRHISTHIRESPQAMHRTKLKDLATQTYIRWQELLTHCQPQAQYFSPWKDL